MRSRVKPKLQYPHNTLVILLLLLTSSLASKTDLDLDHKASTTTGVEDGAFSDTLTNPVSPLLHAPTERKKWNCP